MYKMFGPKKTRVIASTLHHAFFADTYKIFTFMCKEGYMIQFNSDSCKFIRNSRKWTWP